MNIIPTDFYTEARYSMERIAEVYHQFYGIDYVALRLFSVYGDNEHSKGQYANLISQMYWAKEQNISFEIYGDGETTRDFIHVNDVVDAFTIAMRTKQHNFVYNIGTGHDHTINSIAKAIGVTTTYINNPLKNYVTKTCADVQKAKKDLKFIAIRNVMNYIYFKNNKPNDAISKKED
jgi:UDP-glucose 4-epimerase